VYVLRTASTDWRCKNAAHSLSLSCGGIAQNLLKEMMQRRMNMRDEKGSLYSEHVWCILFKMVIERFDQKLRMADILTSIVKPRSPFASKAYANGDDNHHLLMLVVAMLHMYSNQYSAGVFRVTYSAGSITLANCIAMLDGTTRTSFFAAARQQL
jgi:hypothetical protein